MVKRLLNTSQKILSRQQSSILSAAAVITGSSLLSALLGLWRNRLLVGRFFGTHALASQLDAYWVAFRLPELAFQLLVIGALSAAFIPVFSKYKKRHSLEEAMSVATSMMNIVLLVFLVFSIFIFFFAEEFTHLITADNFSAEQVALAANLSRVMILAQFFFAVSNFLTGMIQAFQRFLIPALAPLAYNIGIIAGIIFLTPIFGIYGPAIGVVLGALLHLLLQLPLAIGLGFTYSPKILFKHSGVKEMLRLMPPRTLAISVNQLEIFASVYFATALSAGSLTIFNLAQQLMSAPIRIFSVPLGQASLPFLSQQAAEGNMKEFKQTVVSTLHHILFLAFPAGILLLVLRIPLVRIAYGSKDFPWAATLLTGKTLAILSLSLFAQGAIHIVTRAFYALHDTRRPFFLALIAVIFNVAISYILVYWFNYGVLGLAAAMSTSALVQFLLLFTALSKKIGGFNLAHLLGSPTKTLIASALMGLSLWIPMRLLDQFVFDTTRTLPLIALTVIAGLIGGGVYMFLAKVLNIPEFSAYFGLIKKVGNWRQVLTESEEVIEQPPQF